MQTQGCREGSRGEGRGGERGACPKHLSAFCGPTPHRQAIRAIAVRDADSLPAVEKTQAWEGQSSKVASRADLKAKRRVRECESERARGRKRRLPQMYLQCRLSSIGRNMLSAFCPCDSEMHEVGSVSQAYVEIQPGCSCVAGHCHPCQ